MQDRPIHFDNGYIKKLRTSKEALLNAIMFGMIAIFGMFFFSLSGRKSTKLHDVTRIAIPTLIVSCTVIYFLFKKWLASITFDPSKKRITIRYYYMFRYKMTSFGYGEFKHEVQRKSSRWLGLPESKVIKMTLYTNFVFYIDKEISNGEEKGFEAILEILGDIQKNQSG